MAEHPLERLLLPGLNFAVICNCFCVKAAPRNQVDDDVTVRMVVGGWARSLAAVLY